MIKDNSSAGGRKSYKLQADKACHTQVIYLGDATKSPKATSRPASNKLINSKDKYYGAN